MNKHFALDTMCFIHLFEGSELYFTQVEKVFKQVERNELQLSTSIVTLIEVLSSQNIENNLELKSKYQKFFYSFPNLKLVDLSQGLVEETAFLLRKYKLRMADAIQIATAISQKADYFVTNDKQLKQIKEIKVKLIDEINI